MRRSLRQVVLAAIVLCAFTPLAWMQDTGIQALSRYVPSGAMLTMEARDFSALLERWDASSEKAAWLVSDNYSEFSKSKLFLRLQEAQVEFATAAGIPIDFAQLGSIAGGESVLALYDIGELRLLYITELDQATALQSALLRSRLNLEPRQAAGIDYWVHSNTESGKEVAFAVAANRLFVATEDTLLGQALELHAGQGEKALTDESWYPTYGPRGDMRLIENLVTLVRSPHFRSYWIQGNITELSSYGSAVSDLFLEDRGIREQRRLVRATATEPIELGGAERLANIAPQEAAFHQAWSFPAADTAVDLLSQKILAPTSGESRSRYELTPQAPGPYGNFGTGGNLETRIDIEPVTVSRSTLNSEPLRTLVAESNLQGLLHVQTSDINSGLARYPSLIGILAEAPWNEAAVLAALQSSVRSFWTTAGLGATWQSRGNYYTLVGLRPLFAAVRGDLLLASDSEDLMIAALAREEAENTQGSAAYKAVFHHDAESGTYASVMAHLDFLDGRNPLQTPRQPALFADNLGSLSHIWERYGMVEIERADRGNYIEETVLYRIR